MKTFEEYLEHLREKVKTEPKDDVERGFQMAVMLMYENYKLRSLLNLSEQSKERVLKRREKDLKRL